MSTGMQELNGRSCGCVQKVCTRNVTSLRRSFSCNTIVTNLEVQDTDFLDTPMFRESSGTEPDDDDVDEAMSFSAPDDDDDVDEVTSFSALVVLGAGRETHCCWTKKCAGSTRCVGAKNRRFV